MLKYKLFLFLIWCYVTNGSAQTPEELIAKVNKNFAGVKDYSADLMMNFSIPGVNIEPMAGKVFFKQPDKFRVRTKGIVFLPKQNPYYALALLKDTDAYTAVSGGMEEIQAVSCTVINVIPSGENDLILGKFWIDAANGLVIKSQLTTKSNGTVSIENTFGSMRTFALPDKIVFTIDVAKFKVPKAVAVDLNSKSAPKSGGNPKGTGIISLQFSKYVLNKKMTDDVFKD